MSKLTKAQQKLVALKLAEEYRWLGVTLEAARICVANGEWDDHPLAQSFLSRKEAQP